jgi:O-antigen/teichoic acid export membrane protein
MATIAGKMLILLFLAKRLSTSALGVYALAVTTLSLATYLLGFEFYVFNMRELLATDAKHAAHLVRDQFMFHSLCYALLLPVSYVLARYGVIPTELSWAFLPLLLTEHVCQEGYRLLLTLSRPVLANLTLFLRSTFWVLVLMAADALHLCRVALPTVWAMWLSADILCVLLMASWVPRQTWSHAFAPPVNWKWIRKGVAVSIQYLFISAAYLLAQNIPRYILQYYHGAATLGVFFFFASMANTLYTLIEAAVISVVQPKLITAYAMPTPSVFSNLLLETAAAVLGCAGLLAVALHVSLPALLRVLNKPDLIAQRGVLIILLAGVFALAASYIPHVVLFVRRRDAALVFCHIVALGGTVAACLICIPRYGVTGAAWASLTSCCLLLLCKAIVCVAPVRLIGKDVSVRPRRIVTPEAT